MRWIGVAGLVALAAGVAGGLVLAFGRGDGGPSREEYVAEVEEICKTYEARLAAIAPPDITIPASVVQSVDEALPLVRERVAAARAAEAPDELKERIDRFFVLSDRAIRQLERLRRAAQARDLPRSADALDAYVRARDAARAEADRIGLRC